ncbi:MAG: hypothetical protein II149_03005, partial [Clostridia bacterium]|nr:hypothetical protein [Clostridia bacterium]
MKRKRMRKSAASRNASGEVTVPCDSNSRFVVLLRKTYSQKSNFLEREINNWKDKYNITIKQALNKQNELTKENVKLKEQNKFLLKKDKKNSNNEIENIRIINNKNINKNINSNNNSNTNKIKHAKNNINGLMTYIKMNFKDKKNKMIKLDKYFLNKKKQNQDT